MQYKYEQNANICKSICFYCPALAYKGIEYDYQPVNLIKDGGEQVNQFFYVL